MCRVTGFDNSPNHVFASFLSVSQVDVGRSFFDSDEIPFNAAKQILETLQYALAHKKATAVFPMIFVSNLDTIILDPAFTPNWAHRNYTQLSIRSLACLFLVL